MSASFALGMSEAEDHFHVSPCFADLVEEAATVWPKHSRHATGPVRTEEGRTIARAV